MNKKQRAAARRNKKELAQRERQQQLVEREERLVQERQKLRAQIERKVKLAQERLAHKEREELLAQIELYFAQKLRQERLAQGEMQRRIQTSPNGIDVSTEGTIPKGAGRFLNSLLFPNNYQAVYDEHIR